MRPLVTLPDTPLQRALEALGACTDARQWVGTATFEQAYASLMDDGWLEWLTDQAGVAER